MAELLEAFRRLSLCPFSCATLSVAEAAWRRVQDRYPENRQFPPAAAQWVSYASKILQSSPNGDDDGDGRLKVSPSMRRLASGERIDRETVEACLGLLRAQPSSSTTISAIRALDHVNDVRGEGLETTTIIPFQDGDGWAFAVAYPDCIHWYDSRHDREVPRLSAGDRPVISEWTGPKEPRDRPEDSGVLMLVGIRRIHQGAPHFSQEAADQVRPSFRARLLAELSCGTLEPSDEEFSAVAHESEEPPSFFADASFFDTAAADPSPSPTPPRSNRSPPPTAAGQSGLDHPRSAPAVQSARTLPAKRQSSRVYPDDRRMILGYLSDAVLAKRSLQPSSQTSLAVLWESVKRGSVGSLFHKRYNAVLFHDRMESLGEDEVASAMNYPIGDTLRHMRSEKEQCRFWREVCDIRHDWGPGQYTLLLAVPRTSSGHRMRASEKNRVVSGLRARLADPSDPLERWLEQAQPMCKAIIGTLPADHMLMDMYHLKQHQVITDADYEVFANPDPHAKRALPRRRTNAARRT